MHFEGVVVLWIIDVLEQNIWIHTVQTFIFKEIFCGKEVDSLLLHLLKELLLLFLEKFIHGNVVRIVILLAHRILL